MRIAKRADEIYFIHRQIERGRRGGMVWTIEKSNTPDASHTTNGTFEEKKKKKKRKKKQ